MGNILGFEDEDLDDIDPLNTGSAGMKTSAKFEKPDSFIHFMSSKLSRREKIRLRVRDKDDKLDTVVCYRVVGTSVVDNARFIFRINNMIDNMLVLSRIARSTQYNLVKIEVGNASAGKTQQILMDTRRRLEGSTKIKKNVGMKTDPSPIPINSNVYIPTRDGKGDVTVEPVGDSVDVRSIVDVDYFKDKEFAALKVPKQYLGFDECLKYETKVRLLDGHVYEIGYLAEHPELWEGKSVMTCSPEGVLSPSKIVHVKKTRKDATYVRVRIDNGEYVDVTPDHLMMLRDGTFKEAGKLVPGDSLMPLAIDYQNHKVVSVEPLVDIEGNFIVEDAYDLGVESENHTFPLEIGIFVHNSLSSLGNNSLVKMDLRYARSVLRVQSILINGIKALCNNYLAYRGRKSDINKFKIKMRPLSTSENTSRVEEFITNMQAIDSVNGLLESYKDYIDKPKLLKSLLLMVGISPSEIASKEFATILQEIEKGTYDESKHKKAEPEDEGDNW